MTCCKSKPGSRLEQAALCCACEWGEPFSGSDAQTCGFDGQTIALHVNGYPCPLNRAPDRDGISTDMGVRWRGIAWPRRAYLWLTHAKHPAPGRFPGCGCLDAVKRVFERVIG